MHMIFLHIQFYQFHSIFLLTEPIYLLRNVLGYFILQYFVPILGTKYDMVFALVQRMR
jgi:hypothetical protein